MIADMKVRYQEILITTKTEQWPSRNSLIYLEALLCWSNSK